MTTLYDLLGALPEDDAENLRIAFRRAVKGAHPDINPGDPNAALKFRQIVRANEILSDKEQRAAYDHLLNLARLAQQEAVSKRAIAAAIDKLAYGMFALAGVVIVAAGGYLLLNHISATSVGPPNQVEISRGPPHIAVVASAEPSDANGLLDNFDPRLYNRANAPQINPANGNLVAGTGTNKSEGVRLLKLTAEQGHYLAPFARLMLAVGELRDGRVEQGKAILIGLSQEFPQNTLYQRQIARLH